MSTRENPQITRRRRRAAWSYARWLLMNSELPAHVVWRKTAERHGVSRRAARQMIRDDLGPHWLRERADLIADGKAQAVQELPRYEQGELPL